mmetsp:Transcript_100416/g.266936  ORF Transcript_100416/g.266936 Transcript_100416/m.266936 type:complete len:202 (-) Transcript_100416:1143-1748(-)
MSGMVKPAQGPRSAGFCQEVGPPRGASMACSGRPKAPSANTQHSHNLHVEGALVANRSDPAGHAVRLDLALHPHQPGLLLLPGPLPNLDDLTLFQLPGGVLQLPRCILGAATVQLEGLCQDSVFDNLEEVATVLQEDGALVARQGDPSLDIILHDLRLDPQNIHGVFLGWPLQDLHDLTQVEPPQSLALLDADSCRDDSVL